MKAPCPRPRHPVSQLRSAALATARVRVRART